jgi:F0F1-type ATP synthase membrane subunit b/b'
MTAERIPTLVDQLAAAAVDARQALAELRSEQRETRKLLREIAEERQAVQLMVRSAVTAEIDETVRDGLADLEQTMAKTRDQAIDRINAQFDRLANILLTGNARGRTDKLDLRRLIEEGGGL